MSCEKVEFFVPGLFKAKGRPRTGKGFTYTPAATVSYEKIVRACGEEAMVGRERFDCPLFADIDFIFPRPKNRPYDVHNQSRPDIDNCLKTILDALNGIVYNDDAKVVSVMPNKFYEWPNLYAGKIGVNVVIYPAERTEYPRPPKPEKRGKKCTE